MKQFNSSSLIYVFIKKWIYIKISIFSTKFSIFYNAQQARSFSCFLYFITVVHSEGFYYTYLATIYIVNLNFSRFKSLGYFRYLIIVKNELRWWWIVCYRLVSDFRNNNIFKCLFLYCSRGTWSPNPIISVRNWGAIVMVCLKLRSVIYLPLLMSYCRNHEV